MICKGQVKGRSWELLPAHGFYSFQAPAWAGFTVDLEACWIGFLLIIMACQPCDARHARS